MEAISRLIVHRPYVSGVVLAVTLMIAAFGSIFVGFEIAERKLPTYGAWKSVDQLLAAAVPDRPPVHAAQLNDARIETMLLTLATDVKTVELDTPVSQDMMANGGGGMASLGDDLLLLSFDGKIRAARPGEAVRVTAVTAPETHRDAFKALENDPAYAGYSIYPAYIRYNDLLLFEDGERRGLLASYTEFHAEEACFTSNVARLDFSTFAKSIDDVKAGPGDWTIIYRSKPCLKLKTRHNAVEAHMAGGRMALLNPSTVILTVGDFHMDGMVSDGLGIAQDPEVDYGKVMQIGIQTGAVKQLSMGHRNQQGVVVDDKGDIYVAEHGPRGGDEINRIVEGRNYGWPKESYGITYTGDRLPESAALGRHDDFEEPVFAWMPSVAVSGMIQVRAGFDDAWTGDMLVGSLSSMALHRVRFANGRPVYSERIPIGSRIRAVHQHTNGQIVLWTDNRELIWLTAEGLVSTVGSLKRFVVERGVESDMAHKLEVAVTRCAECHSFAIGANQKTPSLGRIFGDDIASTDFPAYSGALSAKAGKWTEENLAKFLADPQSFAPGATMTYGIGDDPALVKAVIDYLKFYDNRF